MTTKLVTAFDSDSPPPSDVSPESLANKFDFEQVFVAIQHDTEVASNVFARCAKKLFRGLLTGAAGVRLTMPDDAGLPMWMAHTSFTWCRRDNDWERPLLASHLENLVERHAEHLLNLRDGNATIELVGPLLTKVSEVSEGVFTFSVKQKWALNEQA